MLCDDCLRGQDAILIDEMQKESIKTDQLAATISGILIKKYLNTKQKLSKPARRFIISFMDKGVMAEYRAIKFINLYSADNLNCGYIFHPVGRNANLYFNRNDFSIICEICLNLNHKRKFIPLSENLKISTETLLNELNMNNTFRHLIWSNVISSETQQRNNEVISLAEAFVMNHWKLSIKISSLACGKCGKIFNYGFRFPLVLECFHVKCFACYLSDQMCVLCNQSRRIKERFEGCGFDLSKFAGRLECVGCKREVKNRNSLPFHRICDCVVCGVCAKLPFEICKCNPGISLGNRLNFKICKRALISLVHETCPVCEECENDCVGFDSSTNLFLCGKHFMGDLNDYKEKVNFIKFRKLKDLFNSIGQDLISDEYIKIISEFVLPVELKYTIKTKGSPIYIKSYLSLYKYIYPITSNDRRIFDTEKLKNLTYSMTINASKRIELLGLVVSGAINKYSSDSIVRINVKVLDSNNFQVEKEAFIEGPAGFVNLNKILSDTIFRIEIRFLSKYFINSGSSLAQNKIRFENHGIEFLVHNGYKHKEVLFGPVLGFTYKHFL